MITSNVGYFVRHDQMMLRVHCCLHVVANNSGSACLHRTGIGIGKRYLLVRSFVENNFNFLERLHLCLQRGNLVF